MVINCKTNKEKKCFTISFIIFDDEPDRDKKIKALLEFSCDEKEE